MTQIALPLGATNSGTNDWADVHNEDQAIVDVVNGNLDNSNIVSGADISGTKLAATSVAVSKIGTVPAAHASRSTTLSISNSADQVVTLPTETFDTDTLHSTSVNTDRMTIATAGVYSITGTVFFINNATGQRNLHIYLNGATKIASMSRTADGTTENNLSVSMIYKLAGGDYVGMQAWQNSGGALNVVTASLGITWVGHG